MRYVAVGDSFTEGLGDTYPDGRERGWADLFAQGIATASGESIEYANLAIRGRKLRPIMVEQISAALALDPLPTMITINGGGNDMLRVRMNIAPAVELTERAVRQCVDAGVRVVLLSGPDPSLGLPFGRRIGSRGMVLTDAIRDLVDRYPITFVDNYSDQETRRPGYWSEDRLHLNTAGHTRTAWRMLTALGYAPSFELPHPSDPPAPSFTDELRYYRDHVLPWMQRHFQGKSSGDARTAKYPTWVRIDPASSTLR
mgnify:CR=1 FL=1